MSLFSATTCDFIQILFWIGNVAENMKRNWGMCGNVQIRDRLMILILNKDCKLMRQQELGQCSTVLRSEGNRNPKDKSLVTKT